MFINPDFTPSAHLHQVPLLLHGRLPQIANSLRSRQHGTGAGASLPQMPTLLYLLGSPSFRDVVVSGALIASLADILTRAISSASTWAGHQDVKVHLA